MSFFSSLVYYRPGPPPKVTGDGLSQLIRGILNSEFVTDSRDTLEVKFGDAIDPESDEEDEDEIDWDIAGQYSLSEMIDALSSDQRLICRADVSFKTPCDSLLDSISRRDSPENEVDLNPDCMAIEIRPVKIRRLENEEPFHVGWASMYFSGYGYLYPWTLRDVVARAESSQEMQHLMQLCRSHWPVAGSMADPSVVALRKRLGELWPYDKFDKPWDWCWGVVETG